MSAFPGESSSARVSYRPPRIVADSRRQLSPSRLSFRLGAAGGASDDLAFPYTGEAGMPFECRKAAQLSGFSGADGDGGNRTRGRYLPKPHYVFRSIAPRSVPISWISGEFRVAVPRAYREHGPNMPSRPVAAQAATPPSVSPQCPPRVAGTAHLTHPRAHRPDCHRGR
jgi:hypothetical protein